MATINLKLIDSLAQIILAQSEDAQTLLGQRIQQDKEHIPSLALDQFFDDLSTLPTARDQLTLEEISEGAEIWQFLSQALNSDRLSDRLFSSGLY